MLKSPNSIYYNLEKRLTSQFTHNEKLTTLFDLIRGLSACRHGRRCSVRLLL